MTIPWRPLRARHSLRTSQLRASRTRVARHFLSGGPDHMFDQHAESSFALSFLKRALHQPVFPRVVAQHHPPAARIHCGGSPRKKTPRRTPPPISRHPQPPKPFFFGVQYLPFPPLSRSCPPRVIP